jgi:hypothetical protein
MAASAANSATRPAGRLGTDAPDDRARYPRLLAAYLLPTRRRASMPSSGRARHAPDDCVCYWCATRGLHVA